MLSQLHLPTPFPSLSPRSVVLVHPVKPSYTSKPSQGRNCEPRHRHICFVCSGVLTKLMTTPVQRPT